MLTDNIQVIEHWTPTVRGRIAGNIEGRGGVRTSQVVSLNGDLVTTKTGSVYRLGKPHPFIDSEESINWHWKKAVTDGVVDSFGLLRWIMENGKKP